MSNRLEKAKVASALAVLFAFGMTGSALPGQSNLSKTNAAHSQAAMTGETVQPTTAAAREKHVSPYLTSRTIPNEKAVRQYQLIWGIDNIVVKQVASGALVRFSYRVIDPNRARILNDEKLSPQLIDETTGAALQIPVMEKVGKLRQTAPPEPGREYWMVFSNKGGYVKPGNRVTVVIGNFQIHGLIVQ
jgi:hypothetical protein